MSAGRSTADPPPGTGPDSDTDVEDAEPTYSDGDESEDQDEGGDPTGPLPAKSASGKVKGKRGRNERVVAPEECRAHLRLLFHKEAAMCSLLYGRHGHHARINQDGLSYASADMFFMEVLPVSPTRFRPPAKMGDTLFEHPQNELLSKVLNTSYRLRDLNQLLRTVMAAKTDVEAKKADRVRILGSLLETLIVLQSDVNSFIDSGKNPTPMRQGKLPPAGVKQGLEKKEGLFRMHMMVRFLDHLKSSVLDLM